MTSLVTMNQNKCSQCNKKLTLTNKVECKCNKLFCTAHGQLELHNCSELPKIKAKWKNELKRKLENNDEPPSKKSYSFEGGGSGPTTFC